MPGSDEQVSLETTLLRPELVQALTNLNIVGLNKRKGFPATLVLTPIASAVDFLIVM